MTVINAESQFAGSRLLSDLDRSAVARRARMLAMSHGCANCKDLVEAHALAKLDLGATPAEALAGAREMAVWYDCAESFRLEGTGIYYSLSGLIEAHPGLREWATLAQTVATYLKGRETFTALGLPT